MGTRAVVIDTRVDGRGFWVRHDGYPAGLGVELNKVFSANKTMEQVYAELINFRIEHYLKKYGSVPEMDGDFFPLTPEQVNACKHSGSRALWSRFGIDSAYIYRLKHDGVYVIGGDIPRSRKVRETETDRG